MKTVVRSAGILLYRASATGPEVLLVHPGGPFWARRDHGAWSIPKGVQDPSEDARSAAVREFLEETGHLVEGDLWSLGEAAQPSRKVVIAFALQGDLDVTSLRSNTFDMQWPPRSGRRQTFPEVDRGQWFSIAAARIKILPGQAVFLDRLTEHLRGS